jgi:probable aminopeptidase NPEPL1
MATLTGAQAHATGKYHAAILTNSEMLEAECIRAGKKSGDLGWLQFFIKKSK